jgi:hypothetical protein
MPLPDDFLEQLPEEYRDNETLKRFNSPVDLAKSYVELRGLQGNSIRIPGKDAGEEDRKKFLDSLLTNAPNVMLKPNFDEKEQNDEFWRTLGWPDKPEAYDPGEEVKLDDDVLNEIRTVAHDARLTTAQANKLIKAFNDREMERQNIIGSKIEGMTKELKQQWGVTFEDRVNAAQKINEQFYPGREFSALSPKEIEALYKVHESLTGKGPQAPSQDGQQSSRDTPEEAKEKYAEIMRRVHAPDSDLSRDEKLKMVQKGMDILVKAGVARADLNELRAGMRA